MLRRERERGQVTAEYAGMLLLVALVVGALVVAGPAQRIAAAAAGAICEIAGGDCGAAPAPAVDRQDLERAAHDPAFGATRFHTGDISGHSSYFNEGSESLRNIGLIAAGYLDEVNVNDGIF